jgi:hypothetical protein
LHYFAQIEIAYCDFLLGVKNFMKKARQPLSKYALTSIGICTAAFSIATICLAGGSVITGGSKPTGSQCQDGFRVNDAVVSATSTDVGFVQGFSADHQVKVKFPNISSLDVYDFLPSELFPEITNCPESYCKNQVVLVPNFLNENFIVTGKITRTFKNNRSLVENIETFTQNFWPTSWVLDNSDLVPANNADPEFAPGTLVTSVMYSPASCLLNANSPFRPAELPGSPPECTELRVRLSFSNGQVLVDDLDAYFDEDKQALIRRDQISPEVAVVGGFSPGQAVYNPLSDEYDHEGRIMHVFKNGIVMINEFSQFCNFSNAKTWFVPSTLISLSIPESAQHCPSPAPSN